MQGGLSSELQHAVHPGLRSQIAIWSLERKVWSEFDLWISYIRKSSRQPDGERAAFHLSSISLPGPSPTPLFDNSCPDCQKLGIKQLETAKVLVPVLVCQMWNFWSQQCQSWTNWWRQHACILVSQFQKYRKATKSEKFIRLTIWEELRRCFLWRGRHDQLMHFPPGSTHPPTPYFLYAVAHTPVWKKLPALSDFHLALPPLVSKSIIFCCIF